MKPTLLLLVFILLISCNKKKDIKEIIITDKNLCEVYNKIPKEDVVLRYAALHALEKATQKYCSGDFDYCIIKNHALIKDEYTNRLTAGTGGKTISFDSLEVIYRNGVCLENYIGFKIENDTVKDIKLIDFDYENKNRYSIPLFKALKKQHNLTSKDSIRFELGIDRTNKNFDVIFKVIRHDGEILEYVNIWIEPSNIVNPGEYEKMAAKLPVKYIYKSE